MLTPKERILEQSAILFHEQGYNLTGINQIISEARVAKASFYQYFPSKEELAIAYLELKHQLWMDEFQVFTSKSKKNKEVVVAAFDFIAHLNYKEKFRGCPFIKMRSEIKKEQVGIFQIIKKHQAQVLAFFQSYVSDTLLAFQLYLLFEGCWVETHFSESNEAISKAKTIIKAWL